MELTLIDEKSTLGERWNAPGPRGVELDATDKAVAAWLRPGRRGVLAGLSAGALHNMRWIDANLPAELNRQSRDKISGIVLHSDVLAADEICQRRGMLTTTAARTAFDIGRIRDVQTAVIRLDALRNATHVSVDQIEVYDDGVFVARLDMGWPEYQVAVEFDGAQHWTDARQRSRDIDRIAELDQLGWIVIRVSAEMLRARPHVIPRRVRQALIQRGLVVEKSG